MTGKNITLRNHLTSTVFFCVFCYKKKRGRSYQIAKIIINYKVIFSTTHVSHDVLLAVANQRQIVLRRTLFF